jgi:nuclease S1
MWTHLRVRRAAIVLAVSLFLLVPHGVGRLLAWGAQGHHIVARIAWALMTPAARTGASSLLGGGQDTFVGASTWADDVRSSRPQTYNWHFVDIPVDQARYDARRDCAPSEKGDCVVAELARARAELADAKRPADLRAESLKFLIHFVGDLHQPLHAIDDHDRGGNDVHVASLRDGPSGRPTNLHAVWDTGIINLSSETEAAHAEALLAELKVHPADVRDDIVKWAEESHDIALRVAYQYPEFSPAGPPKDAIALSQAYITKAAATMDRRLMTAGARLAMLLNGLLGR